MKKFAMFICLCLLVASMLFMFVFSVFLPRVTESNYSLLKEWPEFSFGTLFSGEYFKDMVFCFTDTIHGRDTFIDFETKISALYGIKDEENIITIKPDEEQSEEESSEAVSEEFESSLPDDSSMGEVIESAPESSFIPDESEPDVSIEDSKPEDDPIAEISGSIIIIGTRAMEIVYANEGGAQKFANVINDFAAGLDSSVNVYSMVIPKSSAYYLEQAKQQKYKNLAPMNKKNIDAVSQNLSDRVIDVNVYNVLGQHVNEEVFARTDHHWTALGAYYASSVFAEKAGVAFDSLDKFTESRREGYLGTYYYAFSSKENNSVLLKNPEDFLAYYPDTSYTATYYSATDLTSNGKIHYGGFFWEISDSRKSDWYSTFIRGDSYSIKAVSNECKNGRKLLIVKDSYGNALAPFMMEGFEEVYIVDARKYTRSLKETISEFGITDVLFAECTFSAVGSAYISSLKELCK